MNEKRREQRLLCAELVHVTYREESGRDRRFVANLEDICTTGLCLQSELRVPDGAPISIRYAGGELSGKVRYCVFREIGFLIGIEFAKDSRWSEEDFLPEHLLDPEQFSEGTIQ